MFRTMTHHRRAPSNALHTCLCPAFQSDTWHSREQCLTLPQLWLLLLGVGVWGFGGLGVWGFGGLFNK